MRTIVNLPEELIAGFADLCEQERISRAEAVPRAVADYLKARHSTERGSYFGMWRNRGRASYAPEPDGGLRLVAFPS